MEHIKIWGRYQAIETDDPEIIILRDTVTKDELGHRCGDQYPEPAGKESKNA
jgi:hypothetical protein